MSPDVSSFSPEQVGQILVAVLLPLLSWFGARKGGAKPAKAAAAKLTRLRKKQITSSRRQLRRWREVLEGIRLMREDLAALRGRVEAAEARAGGRRRRRRGGNQAQHGRGLQ